MTNQPARTYGPVQWSDSVRERACTINSENNDKPVTGETVDQWVSNFDRLSGKIREDHEALLAKLEPRTR